jgi:hypothetical protein
MYLKILVWLIEIDQVRDEIVHLQMENINEVLIY